MDNVLEFDEAQGLTEEAMHAYLRRNNWRFVEHKPGVFEYRNAADNSVFLGEYGLRSCVSLVAGQEKRSTQALLRDVNPRMRPFPSRAAQEAHPGRWLCRCDGHVVIGRFTRPDHFLHGEWAAHDSFIGYSLSKGECPSDVLFWPCDDYAQRVRWPVDGNGVML